MNILRNADTGDQRGAFERFTSRGDGDYANRLLSAMRKQFGGHDEKKERS